MVSIPFTTQAISRALLTEALPGINAALELRQGRMQELSPVDKGTYIRAHKIKKAVIEGNIATGSNYNDAEDAFGVEFGFRKSPVNRHKGPPRNKGTEIYNGIGAKVIQRVATQLSSETLRLITKSMKGS